MSCFLGLVIRVDSGLSLVDVDPSLNMLFGSFKQVFGCGQAVDLL